MGEGMIGTLVFLVLLIVFLYAAILLIRSLRIYIKSSKENNANTSIHSNLGEVLRQSRVDNGFTQEFVAEHLGVSRQAVSKWESGLCEPSTSNLINISKLYKINLEKLLVV